MEVATQLQEAWVVEWEFLGVSHTRTREIVQVPPDQPVLGLEAPVLPQVMVPLITTIRAVLQEPVRIQHLKTIR